VRLPVARKQLLECSFLIPIRRDRNLSDGRPHRRAAWRWLSARLYEFGGCTRSLERYEGWYRDPDTGDRVTDQSQKYTVALPREAVGRLRALLREACPVFAQKSIYLSVAGYVEFIEGPSHETP
jgi:hypothetical protein